MLQSAGRRRAASAQEAVDSHRAGDGGELFGITELCAEFGITLRTIRFYEDKGPVSYTHLTLPTSDLV